MKPYQYSILKDIGCYFKQYTSIRSLDNRRIQEDKKSRIRHA